MEDNYKLEIIYEDGSKRNYVTPIPLSTVLEELTNIEGKEEIKKIEIRKEN